MDSWAAGLEDEADLVERSLHGEVIDQTQLELDVAIVDIIAAPGKFIEQHLVVAGDLHKVGV